MLKLLFSTKLGRCLFAGLWFAAAAMIPVGYCLLLFGDWLPKFADSLLITTLAPILILGFMGLLFGSNILDEKETKTALKAAGLGLAVAALSFSIPNYAARKNRYPISKRNLNMYKLIKSCLSAFIGITILSSFALFSFSCKVAPKNTCEISEEDAKVFLGNGKLFSSGKSKSPVEEGKNMPNVRGCSLAADEHIDIPSLRWTDFEGKNEQEAQEHFKRMKGTSSSKTDISGIGDEAYLTQDEDSGKKNSLTVRKGKNVFLVIAHLENSSEKSVENLKTLAKKIADKTSD